MNIYSKDGNVLLSVDVNDDSYRSRQIRGAHNLTLFYSLSEHVKIPVGAWTDFEGQRYELMQPENFKKHNARNFEYVLILEAEQAALKKYKFKDTTSRRLKFSYTARPQEHLKMLVDNLNLREKGWSVGACIDAVEQVINYNHTFCSDALNQIADTFGTEWEISGKTINLCKVEHNKENPLPLSYGRGNGFKAGLGRANQGDSKAIEVLYVQGGSRNVDSSKYGSPDLLLPKNQTLEYEGRKYITDEDGYSIRRADKPLQTHEEDSLDCTHIYPSRVGEITRVEVFPDGYDIIDSTIPENLDFSQYRLNGERIEVIFQSGMLMGKSFDVLQSESEVTGYIHSERRFKLVSREIDGQEMPNETFAPFVGQKYAVFGMAMPDAYVCDNASQTGASWDMFREAVKYLYENEDDCFSFTGELDGIYAKKDWLNIGGRIRLGGYILFSDNQFQQEGVNIRITAIKDYINNPHSPLIELSNTTVGGSMNSYLNKIEENEVLLEEMRKEALSFTKRRFRDAVETGEMLVNALLKNYTESINPITVRTMQILLGDESLQYRFVNNKTTPAAVVHNVTYNNSTRVLTSPAGIIQHMTLGINSLSSSHKASEYLFWDIPQYVSPPLMDDDTAYYIYIRASKSNSTATFVMSKTAIDLESAAGYYHFLMGTLNSAYDGERSYVDLYGFTEILPGRVTTDRVVSASGQNFFDLVNDSFRIGNEKVSLEWNMNNDGVLRLKGIMVQSPSGDAAPIGVFIGAYSSSRQYYEGDEVTYNGSTYRALRDVRGVVPTNTSYWLVIARKGTDGTPGADGQGYSYIYYPSESSNAPSRPSGTGASNTPSGWWTSPHYPSSAYRYIYVSQSIYANGAWGAWSTPTIYSRNEQGLPGALPTMRQWTNGTTYYRDEKTVDYIVYRPGDTATPTWWRIREGYTSVRASATPDTRYFEQISSFEAIATTVLLAEQANLAEFIFKEGQLVSQTMEGGVPRLSLNGRTGAFYSSNATIRGKIESNANGNRVVIDPASNNKLAFYNRDGRVARMFFETLDGGDFVNFEIRSGNIYASISGAGLYYSAGNNTFSVQNSWNNTLAVKLRGLPTSAANLSSGDLWRDGTTLRIVP
jgi:Carbohydrate binding domain.